MFSLLKYAKNYRKQIILGPFFKFLESLFELFLPLIMAKLVDEGINKQNTGYVIQMAVWMLILSIAGLLCALICQYSASIASQGFGTELRNRLMKKINSFSHTELNIFGTDTLITRLTNDVNQLQVALAMLIRLVVRAPFLSIGSVFMAFYIDAKMGLIFLIMLPVFCLILFFIIKKTVPLYQKVQAQLDTLNQKISQNLSGVRVIRAFARKDTEEKQMAEVTDSLGDLSIRVSNISALLTPATTLIMNFGIILLLYLGGIKVNIGGLQQGEVLALINYMNQMLLALIVVSNLVVIFTRASASGMRVSEVLATSSGIQDSAFTEKVPNSFDIHFEKVSFRYQQAAGLALENIFLTIPENTVLGITGATGSGKSTLSQLIPRFYEVTEGTLSIGGTSVDFWPLESLRKKIAFAPQTAVLFSGTIRENLLWGKSDATDADCWEALEIAQCKEFVATLPEQLDTYIFEGGKNFSGGQKQRLTIARAIIRKPKLLILDDSLSALDYQTDLDLRNSLQENLKETTLIIISQRISSIQQAQQILVLDNGKIVGHGTHQALLEQSKEYRKIVQSQKEES